MHFQKVLAKNVAVSVFLSVAFALSVRSAQSPQPFTVGQVMSAPFASDLIAAPKGASAAWIENEQGRRNIWVASGPSWTARKLTSFEADDGQEIADLAWAPDGSYLLFARGGDFENGGENPNPDLAPNRPDQSIWRVDLTGGDAVKLTIGNSPQISSQGDVIFIRKGQVFSLAKAGGKPVKGDGEPLLDQKGSPSDLRWSPDGSSFAFVSDRSDHSLIGVYRLADKSLRYLDASVDRDFDPVWSPDGTHLVFLRVPASSHRAFFSPQREGQPWSLRVVDLQSGSGREVFRAATGPGSLFHEIEARQQIFWAEGDRLSLPLGTHRLESSV